MTLILVWSALALSAQAINSDNGRGQNGFAGNDSMSNLGTPYARLLPKFLTNNPLPNGTPWGDSQVNSTNPEASRPVTNVTRHYDFVISKWKAAPDGTNLDMLLVNGEFPGPMIECNWGDEIEVTLHNNLTDEGTALHWHGLLQRETPEMDGVPGNSQCPITPGKSFTYKFRPDSYGTTWYHAHYDAQYASGLIGPLVVYGPTHVDYDFDVGPIMVHDYYHKYYQDIVDGYMASTISITRAENNLINGKNSYNGNSAPRASFNFTSGRTMRLRLINPSGASVEKVSIDGHKMTVIANDFVPLEPYETEVVTLAPGQRTDVVVKAVGSPTDSYWLRAYKPTACAPSQSSATLAKAAIFYEKADRTKKPSSSAVSGAEDTSCGNDDLEKTIPKYPIAPGDASFQQVIPIQQKSNGTSNLWYLDDRTFRVDYNSPQLALAQQGQLDFPDIQNVHNYGKNSSIRLIFENTGVQPHPLHLHGHNFFILAEGSCSSQFGQSTSSSGNGNCWDGKIYNKTNPMRRDVHMLPARSYVVVQWNQDNPGIWAFHCHIAWHLAAGFAWVILENPDAIKQNLQIASVSDHTCNDWNTWTTRNRVNQIDAGK